MCNCYATNLKAYNTLKNKSFLKFSFYFITPWAKNCSGKYEIFARQYLFYAFKIVSNKRTYDGNREINRIRRVILLD